MHIAEDGSHNDSDEEREEARDGVDDYNEDEDEEQEQDEEGDDDDDDEDGEAEDGDGDDDMEEDEDEEDEDDDDDEDDAEEDDDEEEEEDDEDEDEEDDDDDEEDGDLRKENSPTPDNTSPYAYKKAAKHRLERIYKLADASRHANAYTIEPVGAAPHSAHVHAMAMSADGSNLITGGSDGHVRRYDVYASMNGKVPLTQNVRHQFVDGIVKGGVMTAWWANEEIPNRKAGRYDDLDEDDDEDGERLVSAVHSLAIQQDALWCLSGTESGNINLTSLRHDPGQLRHVLRKHTSAVSAMALVNDDTELLSGGWDRSLHQWDLHTGQVVRSYPGHAGQITSISPRPLQTNETWSRSNSPSIVIRPTAAGPSATPSKKHVDISDTPASTGMHASPLPKASQSAHATPTQSTKTPKWITEGLPSTSNHEDGEGGEANDVEMANGSEPPSASKSVAKGAASGLFKVDTPLAFKDARTPATPSRRKIEEGDEDNSLFGEEMEVERNLDEALGLGATSGHVTHHALDVTMDDGELGKPSSALQQKKAESHANGESTSVKVEEKAAQDATGEDGDNDSDDGDSLFGGGSADGSPDGDADAEGEDADDAEGQDEDAEGEDEDAEGEDEDAEGEDDDQPLAARATVAKPTIAIPGGIGAGGLDLPGSKPSASNGNDAAAGTTNTAQANARPTSQRSLPKPTFGGASAFASFDGDVSKFSNDIVLTTTLGGQVTLWDRRVPSYPGSSSTASNGTSSSTHKGVRALALPERTPPWCMSACWNARGDKIYVGRRNETVDEWDLRMLPDATGGDENGSARIGRRGDARFVRSLRLPSGSGPVTSVLGMPNARHLVCGSYDNVRLWDTFHDVTNASTVSSSVPFRIVAGHHGAVVSHILLDPTSRFLFTSSGDRGWMSTTTEAVILHEVKCL